VIRSRRILSAGGAVSPLPFPAVCVKIDRGEAPFLRHNGRISVQKGSISMNATPQALIAVLVRRGTISQEQGKEALRLNAQAGTKLHDLLVRLGYASADEVFRALAECHNQLFVNLADLTIPPSVIEVIPESVARENVVLPLASVAGVLFVVMSDPSDFETIQKLQFILNKDIEPVLAPREQIIEAINRHYGPMETECVDSLLREFTDTQIDFTESQDLGLDEDVSDLCESDFELCLEEEEPACEEGSQVVALDEEAAAEAPMLRTDLEHPQASPARRRAAPKPVQRQATVRHYHRMNPDKTFPLLVIISPRQILEVVQRGVRQKTGERFQVDAGSVVEVEPVLPGCTCYPPREQLRIGPGEAVAKFWVVPQVLGNVMQARVVVRQNGEVLTEVPLEMRVVKQTLTVLMAALTCLLPLVATILQHFGIDLRARLEDGLYSRLAGLLLGSLSPDLLALVLLSATFGLYLWLRPRKRDLFWDITPAGPEPQTETAREAPDSSDEARGRELLSDALAERPYAQSTWLFCAERCYKQQDYEGALRLYRKGLDLGRAPAAAYARAALAAGHLGQNAAALAILNEAVERLPKAEITGAMWYLSDADGLYFKRLRRQLRAVPPSSLNGAVPKTTNGEATALTP
jgi:hypothetical protein